MMIIGTNHFVSLRAAEEYYKSQGYEEPRKEVRQKLADGEITLGPPVLEEPEIERLSIDPVEGRYKIIVSEVRED